MRFLPVIVLVCGLIPPLTTLLADENDAVVLAVLAPWTSARDAIDAAARAGLVAGQGAAPFIVYVSNEAGQAIRDLRSAGAWIVLTNDRRSFCGVGET